MTDKRYCFVTVTDRDSPQKGASRIVDMSGAVLPSDLFLLTTWVFVSTETVLLPPAHFYQSQTPSCGQRGAGWTPTPGVPAGGWSRLW